MVYALNKTRECWKDRVLSQFDCSSNIFKWRETTKQMVLWAFSVGKDMKWDLVVRQSQTTAGGIFNDSINDYKKVFWVHFVRNVTDMNVTMH